MTKNIHFLPDSPYSNWYVRHCADSGSGSVNEFYCMGENLRYADPGLIRIVAVGSKEVQEITDALNEPAARHTVYINYLDFEKARLINRITNKDIKIVWPIWGGDLYYLPKVRFELYDAYARAYDRKVKKEQGRLSLKQYIGRLKLIYWDKLPIVSKKASERISHEEIYKAIKRISYCATAIREEATIVKTCLNKEMEWIPFAFNIATASPSTEYLQPAIKEYIQVGNSASMENNHFEALKRIASHQVRDKILLPLSYGDLDYADRLTCDARGLFSESQLIVLRDFMSVDEYHVFLKKVKCAVFHHNIQEALGNIISLMVYGAKVFLKQQNPLFEQFRQWGVKIFSVEEMTKENISTPLSIEDMKLNQNIILKIFSREKILEYYKDLLTVPSRNHQPQL